MVVAAVVVVISMPAVLLAATSMAHVLPGEVRSDRIETPDRERDLERYLAVISLDVTQAAGAEIEKNRLPFPSSTMIAVAA